MSAFSENASEQFVAPTLITTAHVKTIIEQSMVMQNSDNEGNTTNDLKKFN